MSRELLKRALESMRKTRSIPTGESIDTMRAIETYLDQPEPEPVAWMTTDQNGRKHVSLSMMPEHIMKSWRVKSQEPLYTTPPDQSAQIAALKHELQQADEDYVAVEEAYLQCQKDLYDETEKLAALQAKREPLSDDEISNLARGNSYPGSTQKIIEFARVIEAAHGIGINHE